MERDFGPQPIDGKMNKHNLTNHDLVSASTEQLTHKVVGKARRGKWLTMNARHKVTAAYNAATGENLAIQDLFNYY